MVEKADSAPRYRSWASGWRFYVGMLFGGLIAIAVPSVRALFGPDSPAVIPSNQPERGVEWAKLTLNRPHGFVDHGEGRTRWEVVATPTGPGVRATADMLGNGLFMTMLFAPSASPTHAYTIAIAINAAAALGPLGGIRLAAAEARIDRNATIDTVVLATGERSVELGIFRVAAAAVASQITGAAAITAGFALRAPGLGETTEVLLSLAIGASGRAAFAEAFGW